MCTFFSPWFFFFPSQFSCRQARPNKGRGVERFNADTLLKNVNQVGQTSLGSNSWLALKSPFEDLFHLVPVISSRGSASFQMLPSFFPPSPISHPSSASYCVIERYCFCRQCLLARPQQIRMSALAAERRVEPLAALVSPWSCICSHKKAEKKAPLIWLVLK